MPINTFRPAVSRHPFRLHCGDISLDEGTDVLKMLKNAFLSFLAVTDFFFEYRCWISGKFPEIVTFDACMKLGSNDDASTKQLMTSRAEQAIDNDLAMLLLKLSLVSPIFFGGKRVQFLVGAGETGGAAPTWMGPGNRLSERFHKSRRGASQGECGSHEEGDGKALGDWLKARGKSIGDVNSVSVSELSDLHGLCFPGEGSSK